MSEKTTHHRNSDGSETRTRTRGDGNGGTISTTSRITPDPVLGRAGATGRIISETRTDKNGNSTTKKR